MSDDEQLFLNDYKKLEQLEKEKGIKFFECVGDPPIDDAFSANIEVKRQNYIEEGLEKMRWVDVGRFTTEVDRDRVCIPTKNEIVSQPRWDVYVNHQTAMKKRLGDIFLKVSNKVIIRQRAARRIKAIKAWLTAN